MRASQWFVLGFAFLVLMNWFIQQDLSAENVCGTPARGLAAGEGLEALQRYELWCINTEIFDPFTYLFVVLWIVCWINGGLEWWAERKK